MKGWFCNSCKSLNSRGARRCYSCGLKQDFIPVGEALVPSQAGQGLRAPTAGPAASAPAVVVSSTTGAPAGPFAVAASAAASGLAFAGEKAIQRRRRPRRARVLLVLALTLVVAGITAAGVLSPPDWMRTSANPAIPSSPKDR